MVNTYTNVFTGNPIQVSPTNYRAFSFGVDTVLSWPVVNEDNANVTADIMDVTATTTSLKLYMPPANQVGNGKSSIIRNLGANTFTVVDAGGNTIIAIPTGVVYWVFVTDNATVNGTWSAFQYGATASSANAAALAGLGLVAITTTLNVRNTPTVKTTNYTALTSDRASTIVWTGGAGTISFTAAATLTSGWFVWIKNFGTGALNLDPSGAELIDGVSAIVLSPNESCMVICDGTGFYSLARSSTGSGALTAYIATNGFAPSSLPSVAATAGSSMAIGSGATVAGAGPNTMAIGNSYADGAGALSIAINNNSSSYGAQAQNSVAIGVQNTVLGTNIAGGAIGGDSNRAGGTGANNILGGTTNQINGGTYNSIISGVANQIAAGTLGTIVGGASSRITTNAQSGAIIASAGAEIASTGDANLILGGESLSIFDTAADNVLLGGASNIIIGGSFTSTIINGSANTIDTCTDSAIISSTSSDISNTNTSTIISGISCTITATGDGNIIAGGFGSTIAGTGHSNLVSGDNNNITGSALQNLISGQGNTIASADKCLAAGNGHSIAAGATSSTALGSGHTISASALAAIAIGSSAKADIPNKMAHASGSFAAAGDAQTSINVAYASTVGAVTSELLIGSTGRFVLPNDTTWGAWIYITARRTDTDNFSAFFTRYVAIDRNANAASTALVAAVQTIGTDFNDSTYAVAITADTANGSLKIEGTGVAAHTVRWVARVQLVEVTG